jgi:hypothetical protein
MNGIAAKKAFSLLPRLSGGRRWNVRGESFHEDYKIGSSSEKLLQVEYEWGITQGHTLPWRLANWSIGPPTPKPRLEDVVKQLHIGMTMREARTLLSPCSPSVGEGNARHWRDIYDLGSTLELMYEFGGGGYCVDKWKVGDREYPTP